MSNHVDTFAVTGAWLDPSISDSEIFSYSLSISIVQNHHGGGVAFPISPRVKYVVRNECSVGNIETAWIEVFPTSKQAMLLCCVYHPPSQYTFFDNLFFEHETAQLQCPRLLVLGDGNVNLLNPTSSLIKLLLSVMRQVQLTDIIGEPTRITINTSSQIDVILITDDQCFDSTRVYPFSGSDHHLIVTHFYRR